MNTFKFELAPHKDGYTWFRIYRIPEDNAPNRIGIGTSFYLTNDEIMEFQNTMNAKIWEYYRSIIERHPDEVEEQPESPITYRIGQVFETGLLDFYSLKHNYLLSEVSPQKVILINLKDGKRWSNAVDVENSYAITENEMRKLVTEGCTFKLIK